MCGPLSEKQTNSKMITSPEVFSVKMPHNSNFVVLILSDDGLYQLIY